MKIVKVNTTSNRYQINIFTQRFDIIKKEVLSLLEENRKVFFVTNKNIFKFYEKFLLEIKSIQANKIFIYAIPDGEKYKNIKILKSIYNEMLKNQLDRNSVLFAFGGGVIGDMAGFAASTFMRGIDFYQMPTTLLGMVDSSIGGKVAINHALGKNMIGQFYQPQRVFIDTSFLETLPHSELLNGMAEVIKHGLIRDQKYFSFLSSNLSSILDLKHDLLTQVIEGSCQIKSAIVSEDEKEKGIRGILNYGHTFGHALETSTRYKYFKHGEAVIQGMRVAARYGKNLGFCDNAFVEEQENLLNKIKIKKIPSIKLSQFKKTIFQDKKNRGEEITFVLPKKIGEVDFYRTKWNQDLEAIIKLWLDGH